MIKLNPYLNFMGRTEEAFNFYKSVFGGEFTLLQRFKDTPDGEKYSVEDREKIMHVSLKIGEDVLMATDSLESMGHTVTVGNNISLSLQVDTREEADRLFDALKVGGAIALPLQEMFWGSYFGMIDDAYGVKWMINCDQKIK